MWQGADFMEGAERGLGPSSEPIVESSSRGTGEIPALMRVVFLELMGAPIAPEIQMLLEEINARR